MIMMLSFNGSLQPPTFGAGATSPRTTYRWAAVPFEHGEDAFNEEEEKDPFQRKQLWIQVRLRGWLRWSCFRWCIGNILLLLTKTMMCWLFSFWRSSMTLSWTMRSLVMMMMGPSTATLTDCPLVILCLELFLNINC